MNSVVWLLLAACVRGTLAAPSLPPLPVNPGGIGGLFRGPNSETIIRGPDGSEITSEQIGGAVQTSPGLEPIVVPDYPYDQVAVSSVAVAPSETIGVPNNIEVAGPTLIQENSGSTLQLATIPQSSPIEVTAAEIPTLATTAEEPHIIETELVDAPEVEPNQSSDLEGPSGSISVRGSTSIVSGPASTTISEPVRRIPTVALPIQEPTTLLLPPAPPVNLHAVNPSLTSVGLNSPPSVPNAQIPLTSSQQSLSYPSLNTDLIPPPLPSTQIAGIADTSSIQTQTVFSAPISSSDQLVLSDNARVGISDSPSIQSQTVSSSPIPLEALPPNAVDLGQTIVSTTQRSTVAPSAGDIDVSRINLGHNPTQQTIAFSPSQIPLEQQNIVSSTSAPILSSTIQTVQQNGGISLSPSVPLLTTASELNRIDVSSSPALNSANAIFTPNGLTGRIESQEQSILSNQIVSNTASLASDDGRQWLSPTEANIPSRPWVNVDTDHILPSSVSPPRSGSNELPISTVLDTVLVQPTDPKNREVIEFGGKQLENVGNIVPVLHHPVLVAGGLTHFHQIPTASISQLTSRNDANIQDLNRYGRQTKGEEVKK
ncbi:proline-rich protein 36-like [Harmonia axyridis]|uniref:proline-rich protein 36-like n=1 Tax=Harmonia axyridis TaxID=115357 RepID=UPI001E279345|nr:proline-rich protein 36-like [Harmonia axyridis]